MRQRVILAVDVPPDDESRAFESMLQLRQDLLDAGFELDLSAGGALPPGAKGAGLEWAQLAVSAAGAAPALVSLVQAWARRSECGATLRIDDDTLPVTGKVSGEQRKLAEDWVARHSSG